MAHKVYVLVYEGCIGSAALGVADLFGVANSLIEFQKLNAETFEVSLVSLQDELSVKTSSGHMLTCDERLSGITPDAAVLMIPGMGIGSAEDLEKQTFHLQPGLQRLGGWFKAGATITANCTATFLLAQTGLLKGLRATTTWWLEDAFRRRFSDVRLEPEHILVDEDRLITSAAGTSYFDLVLHLIAKLEGPKLASLCAHFMVVDGGRTSQRPYTVPWHFMNRDEMIERADGWVRARVSEKISAEDLADFLGIGTRTMNRRFKQITGLTPGAFVQRIRIEKAKMYLETTEDGIGKIGASVGYDDENAFRRAFLSAAGTSPATYRKQFRKIHVNS